MCPTGSSHHRILGQKIVFGSIQSKKSVIRVHSPWQMMLNPPMITSREKKEIFPWETWEIAKDRWFLFRHTPDYTFECWDGIKTTPWSFLTPHLHSLWQAHWPFFLLFLKHTRPSPKWMPCFFCLKNASSKYVHDFLLFCFQVSRQMSLRWKGTFGYPIINRILLGWGSSFCSLY